MPTSTPPRRQASALPFWAPVRAAPPGNGSWCTRGSTTPTSKGSAVRSSAGSNSATPSTRSPRSAPSTTNRRPTRWIHISDALEGGAELVSGGSRAEGFPTDLYYRPTVLGKVTPEMLVSREETFGPIVPATVISDEEEAIRAVNSSPYGLLSAVFTRDLARGLRFA